jgi:hypothetical protein
MKIYIPKNKDIKENIIEQICICISNEKEGDYIGCHSDYQFYKELTQQEYDTLPIHSKEHEAGNVLVYEDGQIFILDGFGYFRIKFE